MTTSATSGLPRGSRRPARTFSMPHGPAEYAPRGQARLVLLATLSSTTRSSTTREDVVTYGSEDVIFGGVLTPEDKDRLVEDEAALFVVTYQAGPSRGSQPEDIVTDGIVTPKDEARSLSSLGTATSEDDFGCHWTARVQLVAIAHVRGRTDRRSTHLGNKLVSSRPRRCRRDRSSATHEDVVTSGPKDFVVTADGAGPASTRLGRWREQSLSAGRSSLRAGASCRSWAGPLGCCGARERRRLERARSRLARAAGRGLLLGLSRLGTIGLVGHRRGTTRLVGHLFRGGAYESSLSVWQAGSCGPLGWPRGAAVPPGRGGWPRCLEAWGDTRSAHLRMGFRLGRPLNGGSWSFPAIGKVHRLALGIPSCGSSDFPPPPIKISQCTNIRASSLRAHIF